MTALATLTPAMRRALLGARFYSTDHQHVEVRGEWIISATVPAPTVFGLRDRGLVKRVSSGGAGFSSDYYALTKAGCEAVLELQEARR